MRMIKVFRSGEIPTDIADYLRGAGSIVVDGFGTYTIGEFVAESELDPSSYWGVDRAKETDSWFCSHGCQNGEQVLIEHGIAIEGKTDS